MSRPRCENCENPARHDSPLGETSLTLGDLARGYGAGHTEGYTVGEEHPAVDDATGASTLESARDWEERSTAEFSDSTGVADGEHTELPVNICDMLYRTIYCFDHAKPVPADARKWYESRPAYHRGSAQRVISSLSAEEKAALQAHIEQNNGKL